MEPRHRDLLRTNRVYLKDNLTMVDLIDHVVSLLTSDMEEEIMAKRTNRDQVVCFLKKLETRGGDAFKIFLAALGEDDKFIYVKEHLEEQLRKEKVGDDCVDGGFDVTPHEETLQCGMHRLSLNDNTAHRRGTTTDWLQTVLTANQRQSVISERAMTFIAREVADVMGVGKIMGFAEGRLRQFQSSSAMPATQISSMFSAWRSKMGSQATVEAFVGLMRDAGVDEVYVRTTITKEYPSAA